MDGEDFARQVLDRLSAIESRLPSAPHQRPIVLDVVTLDAFATWSAEKGNSKRWVRRQRGLLRWWADELDGRDLRRVSIATHVLPPLDSVKSRKHRIATLKCFYAWLREVRHLLQPAEDPTFGVLKVPQAAPAQEQRARAVTRPHYLTVRRRLSERWRDLLDILAATGWHVSELERWIYRGTIDRRKRVLTCPRAKRGGALRTRVSKRVCAIAVRVLERRTWSEKTFRLALLDACAATKLPPLRPGCLRHSVATYAHDRGESLQAIADFLNHRSTVTTQKFYATHAVASKIRNLADG